VKCLILAHGGAGARIVTPAQLACLADALSRGSAVLRRGGQALDSVEATTRLLESSGLFNAGSGAHLQLDGVRRMDAALMEGRTLKAGAVAGLEAVRHPIRAARLVMEKTAHVFLIGPHATRFARHFKLERLASDHRRSAQASARRNTSREAVTATGPQRRMLRLYKAIFSPLSGEPVALPNATGHGRGQGEGETVGAVALDRHGTLAAATSTGGIAFMLPGRVGDSPLIGCGIYADDEAGAVSMTGLGESIIRIAVAKEIVDRMAMGASPTTAAKLVLEKLDRRIRKVEGFGAAGALVLAPDGRFAIRHTTPRMCAGWWAGTGQPVVRDRFR
jgi:beta-aspartyl-peptidase (threonine type)